MEIVRRATGSTDWHPVPCRSFRRVMVLFLLFALAFVITEFWCCFQSSLYELHHHFKFIYTNYPPAPRTQCEKCVWGSVPRPGQFSWAAVEVPELVKLLIVTSILTCLKWPQKYNLISNMLILSDLITKKWPLFTSPPLSLLLLWWRRRTGRTLLAQLQNQGWECQKNYPSTNLKG